MVAKCVIPTGTETEKGRRREKNAKICIERLRYVVGTKRRKTECTAVKWRERVFKYSNTKTADTSSAWLSLMEVHGQTKMDTGQNMMVDCFSATTDWFPFLLLQQICNHIRLNKCYDRQAIAPISSALSATARNNSRTSVRIIIIIIISNSIGNIVGRCDTRPLSETRLSVASAVVDRHSACPSGCCLMWKQRMFALFGWTNLSVDITWEAELHRRAITVSSDTVNIR